MNQSKTVNREDVNLYLVGFMGTGKSTVGRVVAPRIGFRFVDSDHEIEHAQGRTVAEIFEREGEAGWRAMEREFIERGHPATRTVVSCGGGLVAQPGMLGELLGRGVVICLHASLETILGRTSRRRDRPLLEVEDPFARIRELYAARESVYRRAGSLVLTDGRSLPDVVSHVIRVWRREAAEFARARG